jgi:hypothetical protein
MKYTVLLFALLGGCASAITSQCGDDPYAVGENHGRYGFMSQEQVYAAYCGTRFNAERYRAGWLDGNSERPAAAGM